jgi:hypothetical protein
MTTLPPDPILFDQLEAAAYQCWEVLKGQGIVPDEPLDPTLAMNMRDAMYRGPFGHGSTQDVPRFSAVPRSPEMAADHEHRQGR